LKTLSILMRLYSPRLGWFHIIRNQPRIVLHILFLKILPKNIRDLPRKIKRRSVKGVVSVIPKIYKRASKTTKHPLLRAAAERATFASDLWMWRAHPAWIWQMLRAKFACDVRHARVHHANVARTKKVPLVRWPTIPKKISCPHGENCLYNTGLTSRTDICKHAARVCRFRTSASCRTIVHGPSDYCVSCFL
jgi:hypothetical protein